MSRHITSHIGLLFLLIVFLTYFFSATVFCIGGTMNSFIFPVAVAVSIATVGKLMGWDRQWGKMSLISLFAITVVTVACSFLSDNSFDGNFYHQEGVIEIYKGWNPYCQTYTDGSKWVTHYAKMLEIVSAAIMSTTGNLESGKLVNFMLIAASIFLLTGMLTRIFPQLSRKQVAIISLLFLSNPIVITQSLTFYNDYALYCCLLIVVSMFMYTYNNIDDKITWGIAVIATTIAMGTKFTHFFYIGLAWIFFIILLLWKKRNTTAGKCVIAGIISLLVGGLFLGWHPYITNTLGFGHPLYPLMGGIADIMTGNTPDIYIDSIRFINFIKSMMSSEINREWSNPLIPIHLWNLINSLSYDARINGFGSFFGLIFLSGIILLITKCRNALTWYIVGCLLLSCFIFEQSWWARYIPFLYAIPAIAVLYTYLYNDKITRWSKYPRRIILSCALISSLCATAITGYTKLETTIYLSSLYNTIGDKQVKVCFHGGKSFYYKLDKAGINYVEVTSPEDLDLSKSIYLYGAREYVIDAPIVELSQEDYQSITAPNWKKRLLRINSRTLTP